MIEAEGSRSADGAVCLWFALRVKSRYEKAVASAVRQRGFKEFLPLYNSRREWSDRSKVLQVPLFPGYVFCRLAAHDRLALLTIPGVLHMVSTGKVPTPIDDSEMAVIESAILSGALVEPWPFLEAGRRIKLSRGPLAGMEGFLVEASKQHRVVVGLSVLKRSIAVEVDRDWVEVSDGLTAHEMEFAAVREFMAKRTEA
jgi:transcription antitermination factor NusG